MKTLKNLLFLTILFCIISTNSFAQKPLLTEEEQVHEAVKTEIDAVLKDKDFVKQKSKKFAEVSGTMTIDIGVKSNGKVSTFFKVEDDIDKPMFTNFVSDYILNHKFYFKLPKKQHYKIQYIANFLN